MANENSQLAGLIWSVSDLLRGDFKSSEYGRIILPFTVLRRLDCLLAPTKQAVLEATSQDSASGGNERLLMEIAGQPFFNISPLSLDRIDSSPQDVGPLLRDYVANFSGNAKEVIQRFDFDQLIRRLDSAKLLRPVLNKFVSVDMGSTVSNRHMGLVFEELVRRFEGQTPEVSGEHFTPREVVRLMVNLAIAPDTRLLTSPGLTRSVLDPVCGTGGLLAEAAEYIGEISPYAHVSLYGQEINPESWAICRSNMMLRGADANNITFGNTLSEDRHKGQQFDYLLANPPLGVDWKRVAESVREEHAHMGSAGRFGAGLPRINDGSLLFLQHMLAKMKPADSNKDSGSRVAIIFNASPMHTGAAGSGESQIRKWIIENDWLEAIVALPDQLLHNTGISTYLWVLSNRKSSDRQGKVVLLNARDHWQKMRTSVGSKRKYFGPDQINEITQLYAQALTLAPDHPQRDKVRVLRSDELGYRRIIIEHPLRLRYELSEESLTQLAASRVLQKTSSPDALLTSLRPLIRSKWPTKAQALSALRQAATENGLTWPAGLAFEKAVRIAIGVRDDQGEVLKVRGIVERDQELREAVNLPLHEDPDDYLKREVHPRAPDAWIAEESTKVGYEISPTLFFVAELDGPYEPLHQFARLETARVSLPHDEDDTDSATDRPKHLRAQDLHHANSALELPEAPKEGPALTPCTGGDLVGRPGNWRLLPAGFGEAVTTMFVLRPLQGDGRGLCEWLNSRKETSEFPNPRELLNMPVPVGLVADEEVDGLLEDVQEGRRALRAATSNILPNVFTGNEVDIQGVRKEIRLAAYEARLIGELVRPLDDPVWRAEWSYPYHVAALARRYRISTHPAERKDGLLKLGEGIARVLGLLSLSEIIAQNGFTNSLRKQFRTGATFGTWLWFIDKLLEDTGTPHLRELAALREIDGARSLLEDVKDFRNNSHHAHGVRATHELNEDVEKLEPNIVSAISAASWLSGMHWDWVERCEYLDESSYKLVGLRLRGSHPSWEPFERSSTYPLKPDRIYVNNTPADTPVDLWPLAAVSICRKCRTQELFLLNQIRDGVMTLRSLEEHSMEISYNGPD
ncbi:N-6 DNA methylase [Streptomyces sp. RPA4-2]|uniref:type I restriction-modification system subunit M n=1 Tax=Streptomyces sp. RPA4-2 TaxID=2721244 RepID=UPI00143ECC98|nr:class I SAM-dependent DNA methyltransferase [Streptomyces sp. RPA4-2]QIY64636.1 SAM-dependent DNA methyltransferase [Streptomyces sp. RPA4-2]